MVDGGGLENRWSKDPWVRILPPPPFFSSAFKALKNLSRWILKIFFINYSAAVKGRSGFMSWDHAKLDHPAWRIYDTRDEAKSDIFDYIEMFFNSKRRHSYLGYISPQDYELAENATGWVSTKAGEVQWYLSNLAWGWTQGALKLIANWLDIFIQAIDRVCIYENMNKNKIKKRVNEILDKSSDNDFPSRIFDIFIVTLIAINVVCVILSSSSTNPQVVSN